MRRPRRLPVVLLLSCAVAASGLVACSKDAEPVPEDTVKAFAEGWSAGTYDKVAYVDANGGSIAPADVALQAKALAGDLATRSVKISPVGAPVTNEAGSTAKIKVEWTVVDGVPWAYDSEVKLRKKEKGWDVQWTPAVLHPELRADDKLKVRRLAAVRGAILDGKGQPIVTDRPVVTVGVHPREVEDPAALTAALDAAFKVAKVEVDVSDLPARIAAAKRDDFVSVVIMRREAYDTIRDRIRPLKGTQFRTGTMSLAPSRTFGRALLGAVGEVQKEQMDANPGRYVVGDQVGKGGLQQTYDAQLRGTPGVSVVITGRTNADGTALTPAPELFSAPAQAGRPLQTTIDQRVQTAAEAALAGDKHRTALVAIRISDGAILAAANGPDGGALNLAFTAQVPPGSTFKMVSTLGLLDRGAVSLDGKVNCPKNVVVEGRSFKNFNDFELGNVPFRVDFAKSCNTAFAALAPKLGGDGLAQAAASVGIGTDWQIGPAAFTGSVATNTSAVEQAAAAFGQGQTLVSPITLAAATAAVARGAWQPPKLFTTPPAAAAGAAGATPSATPPAGPSKAPPAPGTALKSASVTQLKTMMREVVTVGSATGLKAVKGGPVSAKTGTAEFDNSNPDNTHAWTVGFQGDLAFAIFVEQGGSSSQSAVPLLAKFLNGL